ncbi:MAG: hypothetical protein R2815_05780 [Flavobacteriales bacterium]
MSLLHPYLSQGLRIARPEPELEHRLAAIKAVLFDWDGVFNNGFKDAEGGSPFSEVGSMGVNLLRFALWLRNGHLPKAAVIAGQHNPSRSDSHNASACMPCTWASRTSQRHSMPSWSSTS